MHLVFLNQYYPPDAAPTGVMLEAVVERLVRDGHEVTVLCASGGYACAKRGDVGGGRFAVGGGRLAVGGGSIEAPVGSAQAPPPTANRQPPTILRLPASRFGRGTFCGKLLDYASYYVGVAWMLLVMRRKPDRIVALTTPPLLSVLARLLSKIRGADHAHWVMDLYPDVMAAHGMLGEGSAGYRILAGLARWGFGGRRGAAVLTLGPDMAERVAKLLKGFTAKAQRTRRGAKERGMEVSGDLSSTINPQLDSNSSSRQCPEATPDHLPTSPIQWVPLWAAECRGAAATVTAAPRERDGLISSTQPSTLSSQPSTSSLRRKRGWRDDELIVMYSGNMGLGHRFGEILAATGGARASSPAESMDGECSFREGSSTPYPGTPFADHRPCESGDSRSGEGPSNPQLFSTRFAFFGGGKRRVEVEAFIREHPGSAVEVHDYAPAAELAAHLQSADVHLASLDAAWTGTMVPSKLQGIFGAGRPVIFIGSAESSIGRWVAESGGGWVVAPDDVGGLLAALAEARDPGIRLPRGRAAKEFADQHFDRRTNVARVAAILTQPRKEGAGTLFPG